MITQQQEDNLYKIVWMPTTYTYTTVGKLIKETETTIRLKCNNHLDDEYVNIQKKFIKSMELV